MADLVNVSEDDLESVVGGLTDGEKRELLSDIQLAKMFGQTMEQCIHDLLALTPKKDRKETEAFIRENW